MVNKYVKFHKIGYNCQEVVDSVEVSHYMFNNDDYTAVTNEGYGVIFEQKKS